MRLHFIAVFSLFFFAIHAEEAVSNREKADQLFEATLFDEAISLYQDLIQSEQNEKCKSEMLLRLAKSHFFLEHYPQAIGLLTSNFLGNKEAAKNDLTTYLEALYLLGAAAKKVERSEILIQALEEYLDSANDQTHPQFFTVHYILATVYDDQQQWEKAKYHFAKIARRDGVNSGLYEKAQLALAKIEKRAGNIEKGKQIIDQLQIAISPEETLFYELHFLKGELATILDDSLQATKAYRQAIPRNDQAQSPWKGETFYRLAHSYLKLANDPSLTFEQRENYFLQAEDYFKKHLALEPKEESFLALGQLYLLKGKLTNNVKAFSQARELLSQTDLFSNRENRAYSFLLRAETPINYSEKDLIYRELTRESYRDSKWYPKGWHLRGVNDYNQGLELIENGEIDEGHRFLEQSTVSFEKVFALSKENDPILARQALDYYLNGLFKLNTYPAYSKAFKFLEHYLSETDDEGLRYLYALAASHLADRKNGESFAALAKKVLQENLTFWPQGKYSEKSLYLLALLQYKNKEGVAEEAFLNFCALYPHSSLIPEALFYAAKSVEREEPGADRAGEYRKQIFENYPDSPLAAEAYFFYYPFREYLAGNKAALLHLREYKKKYGHSPFVISALYLLGMNLKKDTRTPTGRWVNKKNLNEAIEYFQEVEWIFDHLMKRGLFPKEELRYYIKIRYQAILERALANLAIADESSGAKKQIFLEYAIEVLENLVADFENSEHPLLKHLSPMEPYPHLLEEGSYYLAEAFTKLQEDRKAEAMLQRMLEKYHSAKITRGYYLSRASYGLGMIAMRKEDYQTALDYFAAAEDASKGKIVNTDQKIDLWIQQSLCYKGIGQMEKAMLILSKAINDDAISSLRVKAMFIRGEIYSSQGRHELAKKQLEATSKKGGEWAMKAKQKLDKEYGYR